MNDKKIGDLRPSQLITTFGPGAIVDLPEFSVIIAGLDDWNKELCEPIYEPRLTAKLKLREIVQPPIAKESGRSYTQTGTLPAYRFPKYMVCPNCRKLRHEKDFNNDAKTSIVYCHCNAETKTRVFPSRFIVACPAGHLDDFPWHSYVHSQKKNYDCKGDLFLDDVGGSGSIADVHVYCKQCDSRRSLQEAFAKKRTDVLGTCRGHRPWLGKDNAEPCEHPMRASLRGASNIYFSLVQSSIRIPPYNDEVYKAVSLRANDVKRINSLEKLKIYLEDGVFSELERFAPEKVFTAIQKINSDVNEEEDLDLLGQEYIALLAGPSNNDNIDFEVEVQPVPDSFAGYLKNLVMVRRLTEIRVLNGFTRIDAPPDLSAAISNDQETQSNATRAAMSREPLPWRPGILTRGEGIFLTLDEEKLGEWERRESVIAAGKGMQRAFEKYCADREMPDAEFPGVRYVLLHSLSHMLMRQLCLNSGYSSSALRERIYSRDAKQQGSAMAGILIYTATPDSEGSLGGLVELGRTKQFEQALHAALEEARFCSGDPLCSEHSPSAIGDVNGAACHACQLTAETSCERSNRFLDRNYLVPTISHDTLAFFK